MAFPDLQDQSHLPSALSAFAEGTTEIRIEDLSVTKLAPAKSKVIQSDAHSCDSLEINSHRFSLSNDYLNVGGHVRANGGLGGSGARFCHCTYGSYIK